MKVILLTELQGKGGEGDVIDVARGYYNNYLGPQGIAILATKGNLKQLEQRRGNIAKREETRVANANTRKEQLEGKTVKVDARVGEEGVLFGSVTAAMIADAIKADLDIDIDRKRVLLHKPIKTAGVHEVEISLYRDIKATVNIQVGDVVEAVAEAEGEDAERVAEAAEDEQIAAEAEEVVETAEAEAEATAEAATEATDAE